MVIKIKMVIKYIYKIYIKMVKKCDKIKIMHLNNYADNISC